MGWFSKNDTKEHKLVPWVKLHSEEQLNELILLSKEKPIAIFKHSTRCSISSMAKHRFEKNWDYGKSIVPVYLDLIQYRSLSNRIAEYFGVQHESPQLLVVQAGKVVHYSSHNAIDATDLVSFLEKQ